MCSSDLDSPGKNTGVGCHLLLQCMKVKSEREVVQSCPTLSDPMDCSLPGPSVHGVFQARVLAPLSPCLQSFPVSGSFQMSQLIQSGGQNVGVSALASVLPMSTQDSSPLGWTGWISLQPKRLSRVFSNTTVEKHQFFSDQLSL